MKYNFEKVRDADYCCSTCFLEDIIKEYNCLKPEQYESIIIVAKDYLAQDLFRMLICMQCDCGEYLFNPTFVEINNCDYCGEYLLSICADGSIALEQMITDEGDYFTTEGKVVFIHEDCNYRACERLNDGYNNIVIFGFDDEENWGEENY